MSNQTNNQSNNQTNNQINKSQAKFNFIFLSVLGFFLFLVPFKIPFTDGESKIFISHFKDTITTYALEPFLLFTQVCAVLVIILTIVFAVYTSKNEYINKLFKASLLSSICRVLGSALYLVVINGWFAGNFVSDAILDPDTGGLMAGDGGLLTTLYITFFIGILILPLLTHFGAVEYIGTICAPLVQKVFKVPGFSAVDAIASFVGDGTIGIVVTDTQYKRGYYSKREAYIIATSFSIVGIAFASAVASDLGLANIFPIFYSTIAISVIIIALITARLPLKKYPHEYYENQEPKHFPKSDDVSTSQHALDLAINQAGSVHLGNLFKETFTSILNIYVGFLPIIMLVGTIALVIAEKTVFFSFISAPLVPLYDALGFSREVAEMMAPATIVGFADMYLPALFIKEATSEAAKFFIGVLAFTQLVFMSETGMVLLKTSIGLNFFDVVKVFLYRTVISLPIVLGITYLLSLTGVIAW